MMAERRAADRPVGTTTSVDGGRRRPPQPTTDLATALAQGAVMADGGLSTMLDEVGAPPAGPMWTGEVVDDRPEAVTQAHLSALLAGARVVLTAGYQISQRGAIASGRAATDADRLIIRANRVALEARKRWVADDGPTPAVRTESGWGGGPNVTPTSVAWVAASIGPVGAALADGSEYRGGYGLTAGELREFHRCRLRVLAKAQRDETTAVDVWWCETIPDPDEIEQLAGELAAAVDAVVVGGGRVPEIVVTMTVSGHGRVPTGAPLDEALAPFLVLGPLHPARPIAVGVNCCAPEQVAPALERLAQATLLPLVVKPNLGGLWNPAAGAFAAASTVTSPSCATSTSVTQPSGSPPVDAGLLAAWLGLGARLVGGCCGTGTPELRRLATELAECGSNLGCRST